MATVGLSGCGTAPGGGGAGARSSDVITRAEIEGSASDSAYEAVERLRRDWLVSRGPTSATDPTPVLPKVFVDGLERGELQALYAISANVIEEIRFIGSSEATLLHGQGYLGGIIQVSLHSSLSCLPSLDNAPGSEFLPTTSLHGVDVSLQRVRLFNNAEQPMVTPGPPAKVGA